MLRLKKTFSRATKYTKEGVNAKTPHQPLETKKQTWSHNKGYGQYSFGLLDEDLWLIR